MLVLVLLLYCVQFSTLVQFNNCCCFSKGRDGQEIQELMGDLLNDERKKKNPTSDTQGNCGYYHQSSRDIKNTHMCCLIRL